MNKLATHNVWTQRLQQIDTPVQEIRFPAASHETRRLDQDEEWCEAVIDGEPQRLRFHDYHENFSVPGLYEKLFYEKLECCSPSCIVNLLTQIRDDLGIGPEELRVLDFGAGNGMVGDEFQASGSDRIVGVDILPEAKEAAMRDRPGIYDRYVVADLTAPDPAVDDVLQSSELNCLASVAALGYGDIPPTAFLQALDYIATPGWLAFNIKEDFLQDTAGPFSRMVRQLNERGIIQTQCYRRYQHRVSVAGEPLYYVAMIALKQQPLPEEFKAEWGLEANLASAD